MRSRVLGQSLEGTGTRTRATKARSEKNLRASEARFRRLFEAARDGILILDAATHRILEANAKVAEMLGASRRELIGKQLSQIGILADEQACQQAFQKLQRSGFVRFEHYLAARSEAGQAQELEFVCNIYDENGTLLIQCNIRDIGERKEWEQRLREALEQVAGAKEELETRVQERTADLRQRNSELEAFSYSLSHDLRAPIRAIVSFTEIALGEFGTQLGPSG